MMKDKKKEDNRSSSQLWQCWPLFADYVAVHRPALPASSSIEETMAAIGPSRFTVAATLADDGVRSNV